MHHHTVSMCYHTVSVHHCHGGPCAIIQYRCTTVMGGLVLSYSIGAPLHSVDAISLCRPTSALCFGGAHMHGTVPCARACKHGVLRARWHAIMLSKSPREHSSSLTGAASCLAWCIMPCIMPCCIMPASCLHHALPGAIPRCGSACMWCGIPRHMLLCHHGTDSCNH